MNQRRGKTHRAALDGGGTTVDLQTLIRTVRSCQAALEQRAEDDSALRFEIFGDYLQHEVAEQGKPVVFTSKMLGL